MFHGCAFSRADARGVRLFCAGGAGLKTAVMGGGKAIAPILSYFRPSSGPFLCQINPALGSDPAWMELSSLVQTSPGPFFSACKNWARHLSHNP